MLLTKNVFQNPFLIQHALYARSALSFGQHSPHNNLRDSPEAFSRVYDHHRGWGAVNIPARQPDISPDLRIHRSKSRICQNVRCSPRGFTTPHASVVVIHSRKCLRTNPRGVVGAMRVKRERRTSAPNMLYQQWILEHVF